MKTVASKLNPDKVAYEVSGSSMEWWDNRCGTQLLGNIGVFHTYGDGTVKHSPTATAPFCDLIDVCVSIAAAIIEDPGAEEWQKLGTNFFYSYPKDALEFAYEVKFKEGKEQWYSLSERVINGSKSKQYDRRYDKVQEWMTGGAVSAFRIMMGNSSPDYLVRLWVAQQLWDMSAERGDGYPNWEDLFKPVTELGQHWNGAFLSFIYAVRAVHMLGSAKNTLEASLFNLGDHKEEAEKEVACA